MVIGDRLRELREQKKFSQGDIEKKTGLLRCYISRVENGHTVPAVATLEKLARAFEVPNLIKHKSSDDLVWGSSGKNAKFLNKLRRLLSKASEQDRKLLLHTLQ